MATEEVCGMAVTVAVSTIPGVPDFETLDGLFRIRASYPLVEDWRGWWKNTHTGTLVLVGHESDLGRIGFFWCEQGRWIVEHWRKIEGDPPSPPDNQLRQLPLL